MALAVAGSLVSVTSRPTARYPPDQGTMEVTPASGSDAASLRHRTARQAASAAVGAGVEKSARPVTDGLGETVGVGEGVAVAVARAAGVADATGEGEAAGEGEAGAVPHAPAVAARRMTTTVRRGDIVIPLTGLARKLGRTAPPDEPPSLAVTPGRCRPADTSLPGFSTEVDSGGVPLRREPRRMIRQPEGVHP
jgi:hypothetical protein